ncbi:MAG: helix-turn-helix domain-containing protein [Bellilinea sp.]
MQAPYWNRPDYQRIKYAEPKSKILLVRFEDDSLITLPLEQVVATDPKDVLWDQMIVEPYEILFHTRQGKDLEIPWTTIRLLSDPLFAAHWVGVTELQAKHIGERLKALRISRQLSSKDVAVRAGITPQSLSRIENGRHDVVFTTLRKILAAMGFSLKDLSEDQYIGDQIRLIIKKLDSVGLSQSFIVEKLIPSTNEFEMENSNESISKKFIEQISRIFGWSPEEILSDQPLKLDTNAIWSGARLKAIKHYNHKQTTAYAYYANYLSALTLKSTEHLKPIKEIYEDPEDIRKYIILHYGSVNLENLLRYIWDLGIPVLPLFDPGKFHGACWRIGERSIIILKQVTQSQGRWLYDLSHELGHVIRHLSDNQKNIIEAEEINPFDNDEQENEASDFALDLLLNNNQEELAKKCVEIAQGRVEYLKSAVIQVASSEHVPVDLLANYMAYRLEKSNAINWWGAANNLQIVEPFPGKIARDIFMKKVNTDTLNLEDRTILLRSLQVPE